MKIGTRVFELAGERYENLTALAKAMGISVSQVYRVREGRRNINEKFIVGAKAAFPECRLDELFYVSHDNHQRDRRYLQNQEKPEGTGAGAVK